jgi:preprotein translocase subunit SecE
MSNQSIQTVSTSNDKYKIILAIVAAVAGVVAYYFLAGQPKYVRLAALVGGLSLAVVLVFISETGRELVSFAKESIKESKKVVWPTRKEAGQMTAVVFGFVLVMAIFLWLTDSILEKLILDVILGFKK